MFRGYHGVKFVIGIALTLLKQCIYHYSMNRYIHVMK